MHMFYRCTLMYTYIFTLAANLELIQISCQLALLPSYRTIFVQQLLSTIESSLKEKGYPDMCAQATIVYWYVWERKGD